MFTHTLPTMNIVEKANMTADTATIAGARGAGPSSLGITPGGGTAAGILQRSVPGGNWEAIFVSLMCVSEVFQIPAEGLFELFQRFRGVDCMQHDAHLDMGLAAYTALSTNVYKMVIKVRGIVDQQHEASLSKRSIGLFYLNTERRRQLVFIQPNRNEL